MPSAYNNGKKLEKSEQPGAVRASSTSNSTTTGATPVASPAAAAAAAHLNLNLNLNLSDASRRQYNQEIQLLRQQQQHLQFMRQKQQQRIQEQLSYHAAITPQVAAYYALPTSPSHHRPSQMVVGKYVLQYAPAPVHQAHAHQQGDAVNTSSMGARQDHQAHAHHQGGAITTMGARQVPARKLPAMSASESASAVQLLPPTVQVPPKVQHFVHPPSPASASAVAAGRSSTSSMNTVTSTTTASHRNPSSPVRTVPVNVAGGMVSPLRKVAAASTTAAQTQKKPAEMPIRTIHIQPNPASPAKKTGNKQTVNTAIKNRPAATAETAAKPKSISTPSRKTTIFHPKASTHGFVVPTDISDIVKLASSIVAEEIRCHPYRYQSKKKRGTTATNTSSSSGTNGDNDKIQYKIAHSAAAALEQFASDIILPSILSSHSASLDFDSDANRTDNGSASNDPIPKARGRKRVHVQKQPKNLDRRVFVASLLSLREVLAMNAAEIFGLVKDNEDGGESYTIKVQSLATALILNAIMRLEEEKSTKMTEITQEFLRIITQYDGATEEFTSCLKRIDTRAVGITPNGKLMKKTENLALRVAYNIARLDHPLVVAKSDPLPLYRIAIPPSNAAFVSVVEEIDGPIEVASNQGVRRREEVLDRYKKRIKNSI